MNNSIPHVHQFADPQVIPQQKASAGFLLEYAGILLASAGSLLELVVGFFFSIEGSTSVFKIRLQFLSSS
jgi:hypothetical protein